MCSSRPRIPVVIRAGDYQVPVRVYHNLLTIYGLHGVPIPAPQLKDSPVIPAPVNPTVLNEIYNISGVSVNRNGTNLQVWHKNFIAVLPTAIVPFFILFFIQSVGAFEYNYMDKDDLSSFFQQNVPNAKPGDDQVYQFVGVPYEEGNSFSGEVAIQYIMGLAPGIKTQYWFWPNNDICGDLHNYTAHMLIQDTPNVNAISYTWQAPLSQVGCQDADAQATDNNFLKLAAMGVTIVVSSGYEGSGYNPSGNQTLWPSWPASSPWVLAVGCRFNRVFWWRER